MNTTYKLTLWTQSGDDEEIESDTHPTRTEIRDFSTEYVENGDWGDEGAAVDVHYRLEKCLENTGDWEECDRDIITVNIEPDHDALIKRAGGDVDCDHNWSAKGEGGCRENPGVWSGGGTHLTHRMHCTRCGLVRTETTMGSQRNPGESDTVAYEMPES